MGGWLGGGPGHYVVTPTRVEDELRLSWAVTISIQMIANHKANADAVQLDSIWSVIQSKNI